MRGVAGIKSILWILVILRGVYGVMGPQVCTLSIHNSFSCHKHVIRGHILSDVLSFAKGWLKFSFNNYFIVQTYATGHYKPLLSAETAFWCIPM